MRGLSQNEQQFLSAIIANSVGDVAYEDPSRVPPSLLDRKLVLVGPGPYWAPSCFSITVTSSGHLALRLQRLVDARLA